MDYMDYKTTFDPLHIRQDETIRLYRLEEYIVLAGKDKKEMENTSRVILNHPRVFGDAILSILGDDKPTYEITGVDPTVQKKLEELFRFWFYLNDEQLEQQLVEPLKSCFDFQSAFRGWLAAVPLIYYDGSKYLPSCMPLDPRWMYWETGGRGLKWSLNWLRFDKAELEEKYKYISRSDKKKINAACVWDDKAFNIYESIPDTGLMTDKPIFTLNHNWGFCPTVITDVARMPHVVSTSEDYANDFKYQGEDIYAPVKKDILYMNELASIWMTVNRQQFETPLQLLNSEDTDVSGLKVYGYGIIAAGLKKDQQFIEIPTKEISDKAILLFREIFNRYEQATLSSVNYGQAGDRQSALAISDLKSARNTVVNPLRRAEQKIYRSITNMWRRQVKNKKFYRTPIQSEDALDKIDGSLFEKKFLINIRFDSITPQENIVNAQLFAQLRNEGLPDVWLYENILHTDDPQGLARQGKQQRLARILPEVELVEAMIEWAGDDDIKQSEIQDLMVDLGISALKRQLSGEQAVRDEPNPANQPKVVTPTPNSNTKAQRMSERTGQATIKEARRAKTGETNG